MSKLQTQANFHDSGSNIRGDFEPGDAFYEALMDAHQGLNESQSHLLNARLILVMANHIGNLEVLKQAIQTARDHLE
jgi:predicted LPLAT superfamily acyltransferase